MFKTISFVNLVTLIGLVLIFTTQRVEAQSIEQLEKELQAALKNGENQKAIEFYYELASQYRKNQQLEKAKSNFESGIELSEANNQINAAQYGWYSLGLLQYNSKEFNDATKSFEESFEYASRSGRSLDKTKSQLYISRCYFKRERYKRALKEGEDALALSLSLKNSDLQKESYLLLSEIYKAQGDTDKAEEYYSNYTLLNEESQRKKEISEMEERISSVKEELESKGEQLEMVADSLKEVKEISEKKQLQIDLLNTEKQLTEVSLLAKEAELKNNRLVRNSLIIGFVLVGLLAIVAYRSYRSKHKANELIHKKNLNIESSINYGLRIQQAMLPSREMFDKLLPDSFVLFKPRDVVSGDFYWLKELFNDKIGVAAVDCTGHGVPGAFMSMIGSNALNSIVNAYVDRTDNILHELHDNIYASLKQGETGNKDGMDMALCIIDTDLDVLHFSGAKNHLIYVKDGEVHQIRGDKHPIGGVRKIKAEYTQHTIDLDGEMYFYLYSDGFVDQFGGPNNMKFMSKKFKELIQEVHKLPMAEQKQRFEETFNEWRGSNKQTDDVLVLGFKLTI